MFGKISSIFAASALFATAAFAESDDLYTLSVQKVPAGAAAAAAVTRAGFLNLVETQGGLVSDHNFQSFFSFPQPPAEAVIVGFTQWENRAAMGAARKAVMSDPAAGAYMDTVEMQALVPLQTTDGAEFDLGAWVGDPDTVIEFAVRRPKAGQEEAFEPTRKAFFDEVAKQPGHLFSREFVIPEGAAELIGGGENWTAVLIGWESAAAFQAGLGALSQQPELGAFQATIEPLTYHATVPQ